MSNPTYNDLLVLIKPLSEQLTVSESLIRIDVARIQDSEFSDSEMAIWSPEDWDNFSNQVASLLPQLVDVVFKATTTVERFKGETE